LNRETYELLIKYYSGAREGFALIKDGIVLHTNKALIGMSGRDLSGERTEKLFDNGSYKHYKEELSRCKCIYADGVNIFGRSLDVRAFKGRHMIAVIFADLDVLEQELKKSEESFKLLKSAHRRLSDSITIVDSAAELMVKSMASELSDPARDWLKKINEAILNMNTALLDMVEVMDTREKNENKGCNIGDLAACVNQVAELATRQFAIRGARVEVKSESEGLLFPFNRKSIGHLILRLLADDMESAETGDVIELILKKDEEFAEITLKSCRGALDEEYIKFLETPNLDDMDAILKKYGKNLYLVRRIALYYDGSVKFERDGCGKKITVRLPRVQVAPSVHEDIEPLKRENSKPWWEMI